MNFCLRAEKEAVARHVEIDSEGEADFSLSDLTIPTLVIHGSQDAISPLQNSEYLAKNIPNSQPFFHF